MTFLIKRRFYTVNKIRRRVLMKSLKKRSDKTNKLPPYSLDSREFHINDTLESLLLI